MPDKEFISYILERCKVNGIEKARIHYENRKNTYLNIENGEIDEFSKAEEEGIHLSGSFEGYFSSTYIEKFNKDMVEEAIAVMKETARENGKREENLSLKENKREWTPFVKVDWKQIAKKLKQYQKEIKETDRRIHSINRTSLRQIWVQVSIFSNNGVEMTESYGYFKGSVALVVQDGEKKQDSHRSEFAKTAEEINYLELGKQAFKSALGLLDAKPVQSGDYTVVFENRAAADLFSYFLPIFEAGELEKGNSKYKDKQGELVTSPVFTMYEETASPLIPIRRTFDDEGIPTKRNYFLKNGRVETFINTSKEAGENPLTGNGFRKHYRNDISAASLGNFIEGGKRTTQEILAELEKVMYITGLDGLFAGVNAKTGDFSVIATGFLMDKGAVIQPVNQITVGGNFYKMMEDLKEVSSDRAAADSEESYMLAPAILVEKLKIGGL